MKIIFEYEGNTAGKKVEITTDAEDIYEVIDEIQSALIAYGFHPNTVRDGFLGKAEQIEEDINHETKN